MIKESTEPRAGKGAGTIVLLVLLSIANVLTLGLAVTTWIDEVDHGAEFDDRVLQAAVITTFLTVVALAGLYGAWLTRQWGPRTYVGVGGVSLVVGLILSEGNVSPLSFVGIALAVVLWLIAETSW